MHIQLKIEHEIDGPLHSELTELRNASFPKYAHDRSYSKQLPHFRYLMYEADKLVGQMGVDHRMISVGNSKFRIFGIIDLCVSQDSRGKGVASAALAEIEKLAGDSEIDFLFLAAHDSRLYEQNGFKYITAECHWLRIHEHKNLGMGKEKIENEFMVKQIGQTPWIDGPLDLLGYLF